jgi:hypothetical protein
MSRFRVKVASMVLLTMNQNHRHDITLLPCVAGIAVRDGDCSNSQLEREQMPPLVVSCMWYTIRDPNTGSMPVPNWTICSCCLVNIQTMCPATANAFAPTTQSSVNGSCVLIPLSRFDHARTMQVLQYVATSKVMSTMAGRADMSYLVNWLSANPPSVPTAAQASSTNVQSTSYAQGEGGGLCPRNVPSTTLKCYAMQDLFDFTICEKCFAEVIRPDADKGVDLARRFDRRPSVLSSGFTCQLYSDRMRRVWNEAAATSNLDHLRQKVGERRAKERELQMKRAQLQQQAKQLMQQADTQDRSSWQL